MAYSFAQLEQFAIQGGFPASLAPTMAAIAMAESSGNNVVQQGQPYATTGWGLWQITPGNSVPQFGSDQALLNPVANAQAAHQKWVGQGLGAWTTYTSGAYKQFMQGNVTPANDGSTSGGSNALSPAGGELGAITGGVADSVLQPIVTPFEHMFDVVMNNALYVLIVGVGLGMVGVGLVLMLKESPAGAGVVGAATGAGRSLGRAIVK
jgi:hypothetical protein